jgi:hypothetical protein
LKVTESILNRAGQLDAEKYGSAGYTGRR